MNTHSSRSNKEQWGTTKYNRGQIITLRCNKAHQVVIIYKCATKKMQVKPSTSMCTENIKNINC